MWGVWRRWARSSGGRLCQAGEPFLGMGGPEFLVGAEAVAAVCAADAY